MVKIIFHPTLLKSQKRFMHKSLFRILRFGVRLRMLWPEMRLVPAVPIAKRWWVSLSWRYSDSCFLFFSTSRHWNFKRWLLSVTWQRKQHYVDKNQTMTVLLKTIYDNDNLKVLSLSEISQSERLTHYKVQTSIPTTLQRKFPNRILTSTQKINTLLHK